MCMPLLYTRLCLWEWRFHGTLMRCVRQSASAGSMNGNREPGDSLSHREMFQVQRQAVRKLLVRKISDYYNQKVKNWGSDQKALFSGVDGLLYKQKTSPFPNHSSLPKLLQNFSSFIKNKTRRTSPEQYWIASPRPQLLQLGANNVLHPWLLLRFATESEVLKVIKRRPKKTRNLDPVKTEALMNYVPDLLPLMIKIINDSLTTGVVHISMRQYWLSRCSKKPTVYNDVLHSYRQMSNLSVLCKVLERVVASRFLPDLLEPRLSAYRACHSTETALLKVQSDLLMALDNDCAAFLALLDLSAAFDTIDHSVLLSCFTCQFGSSSTVLS